MLIPKNILKIEINYIKIDFYISKIIFIHKIKINLMNKNTQLNPFLIEQIKLKINRGQKLSLILKDYGGEFKKEIIINYYHINNGPDLRDYQKNCLNDMNNYFKFDKNINYKIFWICGLGKTKIMLSFFKQSKFKSLCIAVPSTVLIEQFATELSNFFPNTSIIRVNDKKDNLEEYLNKNEIFKIVLTTYHSSNKLLKICNKLNFIFDCIICDEAHHLIAKNQKKFHFIMEVPTIKRIFATATPYIDKETRSCHSFSYSKQFEGKTNILTLDFGIKNKFLVDYRIIVLKMIESYEKIKEYPDKKLASAAYMATKSIFNGLSKKILIYSNTVENSKKIKLIIDDIINANSEQIFNDELNGNHTIKHRNKILEKFKNSRKGIICSVQIFGEGFDYPELDSVLFAEAMTSNIRIVQSGLRACRINIKHPNKIANILIPLINYDDIKLKQLLEKMKQIDMTIIDKIKIYNNKLYDQINKKNQVPLKIIPDDIKIIYEKIELEILTDLYRYKEIEYINKNLKINDQTQILLCPVSDNSYKNFYKSILSINDKVWGFKYLRDSKLDKKHINFRIWTKLITNDLILFIEKNIITVTIFNKKINSHVKSLELWNDKYFNLIIHIDIIIRKKFSKKDFMELIGYKRNFNLQGSQFYKKDDRNKIINFIKNIK